VLSNWSLGNIKFNSKDNYFLAWLKQACIFIKSNSLGTDCLTTIGYFTKIAPELTNLVNFCEHLINQLMLIEIAAETTVYLLLISNTHSSKWWQMAMTTFWSSLTYHTWLSHSREPLKVTMDVLGIKGAPTDAKLLGKFFTCLTSEISNNHHDGVFLLKSTVNLLRPQTYAQVLKENIFSD